MPKTARSMRNFVAATLAFACISNPVHAQPMDSTIRAVDNNGLTYADLVDLSLPARVVVRAVITRQENLAPELNAGVAPDRVRLLLTAQTQSLLVGPDVSPMLQFLADVPLDARGKAPKLKKQIVLLLGVPVAGRPDMIKLVAPDAMLPWSPELETRVRPILTELVNPALPPRVTGVREAMHVPGNLAGEGETQVFLATPDGKPGAISIVRRPGEPTVWGVSFSEIVDQSARPPRPDTMAWYRLACGLPASLPPRSLISGTPEDRRIAAEDYAQVMRDLGRCTRTRNSR
jgi:hypothetical protein